MIDVDGETRLEVFTSRQFSAFTWALEAPKGYGDGSDTVSQSLMLENRAAVEKKTG